MTDEKIVLPDELLQRLRVGDIVLFLGAGASRGAKNIDGKDMPQAQQLSDYLAEKLLNGSYIGKPLAYVGQTAIGHVGLDLVQKEVKNLIAPMEPAAFHKLVSEFRWRLAVTTNYDLILETVYANNISSRLQTIIPWVRNSDEIDRSVQDYSKLLYLKLHGCLNYIDDPSVPLIISPEQFNEYRHLRGNLFDYFRQVASEMPVVWAGFGMMDQDLLAILQEIEKEYGEIKSSHYIIDPSMDEIREGIFKRKNINLIKCSFEDFLVACDKALPKESRSISGIVRGNHPIEVRLTKKYDELTMLPQLLDTEFEHVRTDMTVVNENPQIFYQGLCRNFTPVQMSWDFVRRTNAKMIESLGDEQARVEARVLRAPAGLGKSVALRRLAWDLASEGRLCLYLRDQGRVDIAALEQLLNAIDERLYIFIDNAPKYSNEIEGLIRRVRQSNKKMTVILASRINEWNTFCENLDALIQRDDIFEIHNLSEQEVDTLLEKLSTYGSLGELARKNYAERKKVFMDFANRQLLVALAEATSGQTFERIILNEYQGISSPDARKLYRGVALLHRLGVEVRANLIQKIYKIPYEDFSERFYRPLEKVIFAERDHAGFRYRTRHPEIARMLFNQAYQDPEERLREVINTLGSLNTSFDTDLQAFSALINHRRVGEYFSTSPNGVKKLYEAALKIGHPQEVYRQWGLYELRRGDLVVAEEILLIADSKSPGEPYTSHALAELKLKQAEANITNEKFEIYFEDACFLLDPLIVKPRHRAVSLHTRGKLEILKLKRMRRSGDIDGEMRVFSDLERRLQRAQRDYPGDERFMKLESDANVIVNNTDAALKKLEEAYRANRDQVHTIRQLYKMYRARGRNEDADDLLDQSLDRLPASKELNYMQFERLRGSADPQTLLSLLNKAVVEGDGNRERLFWFSRYAHQYGNYAEKKLANQRFERLRDEVGTWGDAGRIRDYAKNDVDKIMHIGVVENKMRDVLWIKRNSDGESLFTHRSFVDSDMWEEISNGDRVEFAIAYRLAGPVATDITQV